jgi:DnaK suppressor protein
MNNYINDVLLAQFKEKLASEKNSLTEQVGKLTEDLRGMKEVTPDHLDSAQTVSERHTSLASLNQKKMALTEVEFAIKNIEDFGYCLDCGNEIGIPRLNFNPAITKCIDCKTKEEHLKKTQGYN